MPVTSNNPARRTTLNYVRERNFSTAERIEFTLKKISVYSKKIVTQKKDLL